MNDGDVDGSGVRRYGRWAGNPAGIRENPTKCRRQVAEGGRSVLFHQCSRKRGFGTDGLYCKQHGASPAAPPTVREETP